MRRQQAIEQSGFPDITDLDTEIETIQANTRATADELAEAKARVKRLESKLQGLHRSKDTVIPRWMEQAHTVSPLYAASYRLDNHAPSIHGVERLHIAHERGIMLCRLAELTEQREYPVLFLRKDYRDLSSREFSHSEVRFRPATILDAVFTRTGGASSVEVAYDESTDYESGVQTKTPESVKMHHSGGERFETRTTGFDDDQWIASFEGAEVYPAGSVTLLGDSLHTGGRGLYFPEIEAVNMQIHTRVGDVYIGREAIKQAVETLPASVEDREHSSQALSAIQEKAEEVLASAV